MRGGAARGINHLLQNAEISLGHITEIYLSTAAATGNVRELKRLGKLPGANINGCDERGRTAAHIAVEEGQLEALKVIELPSVTIDSLN
jgi:ankyrin repeat protein